MPAAHEPEPTRRSIAYKEVEKIVGILVTILQEAVAQ
jgi:hypothetical protein